MYRILFSIFLVGLFNLPLHAQIKEIKKWCVSQCDIAGDEKKNTELVHLQMLNDSINQLVSSDGVKKIPLRIGIIQTDTSHIEISEIIIRRAIDNLNTAFKGINYNFYLERTEIIVSDLKLEDLSSNFYQKYNEFSDQYDLDDLLSIYIFDHGNDFCTITPSSISCGRTGGFSYILSERTDNIVLSRFDISDIKVIAHEMAHFWGLYHTFEEAQFGKDDFTQENCHLLGDRICDTPPDPGSIFEVHVNYTTCELLNLTDENGHEYKPMIENYMSYYKPCYLKEFKFTETQYHVMMIAGMQPMRKKFFR